MIWSWIVARIGARATGKWLFVGLAALMLVAMLSAPWILYVRASASAHDAQQAAVEVVERLDAALSTIDLMEKRQAATLEATRAREAERDLARDNAMKYRREAAKWRAGAKDACADVSIPEPEFERLHQQAVEANRIRGAARRAD